MMRESDEVDERIMDAALQRILQVGIRRSSLDDIARRSGVNRVTIYRRFSGKDNLVEAVLSREIQRILAEATVIATTASGVEAQIEETVLYILRLTRTHPLVTQLIDVAPEEALSFYTVRGSDVVSLGVEYITSILQAAQERGEIESYDPVPVAELIARLAHSLLLTPAAGIDFGDVDAARDFVRAAIVPLMLRGPGSAATPGKRPRATTGIRRTRKKSGAST
ncbi:TetR/AcrR family transcriptional regulator [Nocardia vinacea]|uniref:TetR/AcrR family transcriptional regulator n=1 Tax=Nocardia vinacea TaxID=96468 RepID=UPI0007C56D58|nr:TetR/AcrR family transcriptional regulator [Nocardia vinacea]